VRVKALLLMLLVGLAHAAPPNELRRGNGPEPATLNPLLAQDISAHNVLRDLFEGLVTESPSGAIEPGQAQSWALSDDGLTMRFTLREGLRFANGEPLLAADFAASLKHALDPKQAAPYAQALAMIDRAEAADERTLVLTLKRRAPELLTTLTLPIAFPLPRSLREGPASAFGKPATLIGNGAYRLQEWRSQSHLLLVRNPHFRDAANVAIDQVRFVLTDDPAAEYKRFRAGDLDITETVPSGPVEPLRQRHGDALRIAPYLGTVYFGFNLTQPPLKQSPQLRRALSLGIDRDILARYIAGAGEQPTFSLVPAQLLAPPPEALRRSQLSADARLAEARAALRQSGYQPERDAPIEIRFNANPNQRRLALAIQAMWLQQLGVRSQIRQEEWKVFLVNRKQRRVTQVFRMSWVADVATAENFLSLFTSNSPLNATGFNDVAFDQALKAAENASDDPTRDAALSAAQARLIEQDVLLPLYHYVSRHLVAARVGGYVAHPLDRHLTRHLRLIATPKTAP
jgi:oligopeptide transport system substrate-binding protein